MNISLIAESSILYELIRNKKELKKIAAIHFLVDLSYTPSARFMATWLLLTTANLHLLHRLLQFEESSPFWGHMCLTTYSPATQIHHTHVIPQQEKSYDVFF